MSFWKDVRDLRDATRANLKAGRGNRSLREAAKEFKRRPPEQPVPKNRHLRRTFFISALFGAIWRGTRR